MFVLCVANFGQVILFLVNKCFFYALIIMQNARYTHKPKNDPLFPCVAQIFPVLYLNSLCFPVWKNDDQIPCFPRAVGTFNVCDELQYACVLLYGINSTLPN